MTTLSKSKMTQVLAALVEDNNLRATSLLADVSLNTVTKLPTDIGCVCAAYQDRDGRRSDGRVWAIGDIVDLLAVAAPKERGF